MNIIKILSKILSVLGLCLLIISCGDSGEAVIKSKPKQAAVILIFGDSISQGYGYDNYNEYYELIAPGKTYSDLLLNKIKSEGIDAFAPITVINASIGGEFTAEALDRLPGLLATVKPTHVLLAHGTNDSGSNFENTGIAENFTQMIKLVQTTGAIAFLADIPFVLYGQEHANAYSKMISNTCLVERVVCVPILNGILGDSRYYLSDGFHFNELAQPIMMKNVWDKLSLYML